MHPKTPTPVLAPLQDKPQAAPREAQPRELLDAVTDIDRHTLWSTLRLRCALARPT